VSGPTAPCEGVITGNEAEWGLAHSLAERTSYMSEAIINLSRA